MELSEVLQLVITILGDGILLFVFQQFYSSKAKTIEKMLVIKKKY